MKEGKHSTMPMKKAWLLLVSLLFTIGLLLLGDPVGADDPIPTPAPEEPTEWSTVTVTTAEVALKNIERLSKGNPKLESSLNQLLAARRREGWAEAQAFATTHMMVLDNDRVQVVVVTTQEAISNLKEAVEALGGEYQGHYETLLQALVPIDALESLAQRPDVQVIREPRRPIPLGPTMAGTVDTEGLGPSNVSAWHSAGFTGSGVRVAVIDAGFTGYSGLLGTDLPGSVTTYDWTGTGMGGDPHGTACAEVVYDMAPGVTMDLHKVSTTVNLGNAVSQAIADGVDIISMSLGWTLDGPGDGTGNLASIVNNARSNGIFFAVAAGNDAEVSWSGTYSESGYSTHLWASGQDINFFGPGDGSMYDIPAGSPIQCGLHWDDWTAVNQNYDLLLLRWTGSTWSPVASSTNPQNGGPGQTPQELIYISAPSTAPYGVVVVRSSATRNVCLSLSCSLPKGSHLDEWVPERSLSFPADSPDAVTVGAVDVSSYNLEPYSSRGPTFGSGGTCSGGSTKPDIAAYANVSTVSYGTGRFNGTSAATPHVAGAAALVKGASLYSSVGSLQNYLENSAIDLGAAGKDNLYGSGRLYLGDPPICFYDGFESGTLGTGWTTYTTDDGRVQVSSSYPYTGTYSVLLDDSTSNSTYSGAALTLITDLSGQSQVDLNFWWREFNDENDPEDGVWISDDDGANWTHVFSFNNGPSSYRNDVIDIDAEAAANGLTLNDQFQISFFFYDNDPIPSDGYAIDEVLLLCDNPAPKVGSIYLPIILKNSS